MLLNYLGEQGIDCFAFLDGLMNIKLKHDFPISQDLDHRTWCLRYGIGDNREESTRGFDCFLAGNVKIIQDQMVQIDILGLVMLILVMNIWTMWN